jgi:outer membrane immunogenic protein
LLSSIMFVGTAAAADLPARMPAKAPMVAAPVPYNWTGFYAGLNLGGSWGSQDNALVSAAGVTFQTNTDHPDGFIGGGQIGYNWQADRWVFGLEADFQESGQKADGSYFIPAGLPGFIPAAPATTITYTDKLEWFGTVRGRVGWAMDRWLPYVTGGWAYGHGSISGTTTTTTPTTATFSATQDYSGWTVGGGVEWTFLNNWSAKVEYLYIDFGDGPSVPATATGNIVSSKMTDNIVRAGLNYKF